MTQEQLRRAYTRLLGGVERGPANPERFDDWRGVYDAERRRGFQPHVHIVPKTATDNNPNSTVEPRDRVRHRFDQPNMRWYPPTWRWMGPLEFLAYFRALLTT